MRCESRYFVPVIALALLVCSLAFTARAYLHIYWINGWRDQVEMYVTMSASGKALDDFRAEKLRLLVPGGENETYKFTGKHDGVFEIWNPPYISYGGEANEYALRRFITVYNSKMRHMVAHPENFRQARNTPPVESKSRESNIAPIQIR